MKMRELVDALPSIRKISGQDLDVKTLYNVSKIMKKLESDLEFYDSRRQQLLEDYCTEIDGCVEPKPEYREVFEREFMELLNLDVTSGEFEPIEIPADENLRLSYADLRNIEEIFVIKFME